MLCSAFLCGFASRQFFRKCRFCKGFLSFSLLQSPRYQGSALPLSYGSIKSEARIGQIGPRKGEPILATRPAGAQARGGVPARQPRENDARSALAWGRTGSRAFACCSRMIFLQKPVPACFGSFSANIGACRPRSSDAPRGCRSSSIRPAATARESLLSPIGRSGRSRF